MTHTATAALIQIAELTSTTREPDLLLGPEDDPYLKRWYLNRDYGLGSIYYHQIFRGDPDTALHDHPYDNVSLVLKGVLRDIGESRRVILSKGNLRSRAATEPHRLEVVEGPVHTLFFTGPVIRKWGFHTETGWVYWRDFVNSR